MIVEKYTRIGYFSLIGLSDLSRLLLISLLKEINKIRILMPTRVPIKNTSYNNKITIKNYKKRFEQYH